QIRALGFVKAACATVNGRLGVLESEQVDAIVAAARKIADGDVDSHFPVDTFQTGSGTSSNMNSNEVIASLCEQAGVTVHPNDHVNASQSSNDVFPTSSHLAATEQVVSTLLPALGVLRDSLQAKADEWSGV